jgi:hypothetical protein
MEPSPAEPSKWPQNVIATCGDSAGRSMHDVPAATFAQRHLAQTEGDLRLVVTGRDGVGRRVTRDPRRSPPRAASTTTSRRRCARWGAGPAACQGRPLNRGGTRRHLLLSEVRTYVRIIMPANWRSGFKFAWQEPDREPDEGPGLTWRQLTPRDWSGTSDSKTRHRHPRRRRLGRLPPARGPARPLADHHRGPLRGLIGIIAGVIGAMGMACRPSVDTSDCPTSSPLVGCTNRQPAPIATERTPIFALVADRLSPFVGTPAGPQGDALVLGASRRLVA